MSSSRYSVPCGWLLSILKGILGCPRGCLAAAAAAAAAAAGSGGGGGGGGGGVLG